MKIRIFDFDDTLVTTNSVIRIMASDLCVNAIKPSEFASYTLKEGQSFDFSDFNEMVKPMAKRHDIVLKRTIEAGDSTIVILTARADGAREAIRAYLDSAYGSNTKIEIVTLGSSDAFCKAVWVRNKIIENGYTDVYFVDDNWENCRAVGDVCNNLQQVTKLKIQKL